MVDRGHLRILRALAQQGSLTKAAASLHLTQSALSHSMRNLERQTGATLWVKEGRDLKLTWAGEFLVKEAQRLLPQLERLDEVLKQFARGERGRLHLGMECSPCYQWLLKLVNPFLLAWPKVDIDVKQQFQFGGLEALLNYEIDMLVTPDPVFHKGVNFVPVFPYEQVLVVHLNHPLAQREFLVPEDLTDQILYTYPVATDRLDVFQQFLGPANLVPKQHKTMGSTEMLLQMVIAQRGVTCLPLWLVEEQAANLPVAKVRLGVDGIHKHIHLGYRLAEQDEAYLQAFLALAQQTSSAS